MMKNNYIHSIRAFSGASRVYKDAIKPVFKPHHLNPQDVRSFDKNLPLTSKEGRPWESMKISKDEFFMRKYGNISPEERRKLNEKVERQRRARNSRKLAERAEREKTRDERLSTRTRDRDSDSSGGNFGRYGPNRNPLFEYVYGTHAVKSILMNNKRESYNTLYVHNGDKQVINMAQNKYGIKVIEKNSKNDLNMLTNNGVHNGLVLETKPLVLPSIHNLGKCNEGSYEVIKLNDFYNNEIVEKKQIAISRHQYPIGLFLDGITDPQNMGGIVRTAYFLGVDFIIVPENNSARLGPVTNKASVGALDSMDIYETNDSLKFIDRVKQNGWNVISTSGKPSVEEIAEMKSKHASVLQNKYVELSDLSGLLAQAPMLLVMGSEGTGLRTNMKLRSDFLVGINKGAENDTMVDSLNVTVASGILINAAVSF
jgi:21S rRNA (GM2251-2'-O)-methyltransferase